VLSLQTLRNYEHSFTESLVALLGGLKANTTVLLARASVARPDWRFGCPPEPPDRRSAASGSSRRGAILSCLADDPFRPLLAAGSLMTFWV